jgi:hypothetical protein
MTLNTAIAMADLIRKPFQLKPCSRGAARLRSTSLAMPQRIKKLGRMWVSQGACDALRGIFGGFANINEKNLAAFQQARNLGRLQGINRCSMLRQGFLLLEARRPASKSSQLALTLIYSRCGRPLHRGWYPPAPALQYYSLRQLGCAAIWRSVESEWESDL